MSEQHAAADVHASSGAYVMDALDQAEWVEFERHLRTCESCRTEVTGMSEAAGSLSLIAMVPPPPEVLERTLAQVRTIRPLPPLDRPEGSRVDELAIRRARRSARFSRVMSVAALVVALAAAAGFVATQRQLSQTRAEQVAAQRQLADQQSQLRATQTILATPDLTKVTAAVAGGGNGTVLASDTLGEALFVAAGLPQPASGQTYQLWLIDKAGKAASAGTFDPVSGTARQVLSGDLAKTAAVGMSLEPTGGSTSPTTTPVFAAPLRKG